MASAIDMAVSQALAGSQRAGDALGLPAAGLIERDVELPLDACFNVPGSFSVAYCDDLGGLHQPDFTDCVAPRY